MSRNVEESSLTQNAFGTLTHVLPLVCWKFYHLCHKSDGMWREAMLRLVKAAPSVWGLGISEVAAACVSSNETDNAPTWDTLCDQASAACGGAKFAFQRIVALYQPYTIKAPLLKMERPVPHFIVQSMNLHLFEWERPMISEVMHNRPVRDKSGNWIPSPRPRFLMSAGLSEPVRVGDPVLIVEILRCRFQNNGTVLITKQFVRQTRIQSKGVRHNGFSLVEASVITCKQKFINLRFPVICMAMRQPPPLYASLDLIVSQDEDIRMIQDNVAASKARILKYYINDEKFCFRFRNIFLSETSL